jgi:CrcB protein
VTVLLVALGAAVGAPLRYLTDRAVQARHESVFPWGTFAVNVSGSFILGLLAGGVSARAVSGGVMALLGTGLCGALTTYSTFGYETVRLAQERARFYAVLNAGASVAAGLGAAVCR